MHFLVSFMYMLSESTFSYRSMTIDTKVFPSAKELIELAKTFNPEAKDIAIMGISKMTDEEYEYFCKK